MQRVVSALQYNIANLFELHTTNHPMTHESVPPKLLLYLERFQNFLADFFQKICDSHYIWCHLRLEDI